MITVVFLALLACACTTSGQMKTQQPPSAECIAANATLRGDSDCNLAYAQFLFSAGFGSPIEQSVVDQVCNAGTCRSQIQSFLNNCSGFGLDDEVENNIVSIAFGCIPHNMAGSCVNVSTGNEGGLLGFIFNYLIGDVGNCFREYYVGMCSDGCKQNVTQFVNQWGCCYAEIVRALAQEPDEFSPVYYGVTVRDYFTYCDLSMPSFCMDGELPPPNQCNQAVMELFSTNDECATSWRQISISGAFENITNVLRISGCADRLQNYLAVCDNNLYGSFFTELLQVTTQLENVVNPRNKRRCSASFPGVVDAVTFSESNAGLIVCLEDLGSATCSSACREFLTETVNSYGCCFNEGARFYFTMVNYPDDDDDNDDDDTDLSEIFQAVTVSLYTLCGVESPGFCTEGPTAPPLSDCESASFELFGPRDNCGNATLRLFEISGDIDQGRLLSFEEVDKEFSTFCSIPRCRERLTSYFRACVNTSDDAQQSITYFTDFGCRRNDQGSCFAVLETTSALSNLRDSDACSSVLDPVNPICSSECQTLAEVAVAATGCCAVEFTNVGISGTGTSITAEQAYTRCSVSTPGRCALQAASAGGAAVTETANVLLVSILLLLITLAI